MMQMFKYRGYDMNGLKVGGEVEAASLDEAERRIAHQSITIVAIIPAGLSKNARDEVDKDQKKSLLARLTEAKVAEADAAAVLRNLAVMSETGVPFVEALDAIILSARTPALAEAMTSVRESVIQGKSLSHALRMVPRAFPMIVSDLVRVAEEGGGLDKALLSGAQYLERNAELKKKLRQAMVYPSVMFCVAIITIIILIVWVLPKFSDVFVQLKANLPWTTKLMMGAGKAVQANPIGCAFEFAGVFVGAFLVSKLKAVRELGKRLLWRLPILGDFTKQLALSRSFQSIATLLAGNVPLMQALENGAKVAAHDPIENALLEARRVVEHGGAFSDALHKSGLFPKMLVQMVSVGERTGRLGPLVAATATKMEEDVDAKLKAVVSIAEPLMIVVMGAIVGSITVSVISPIYSVIENIK